MEQDTKWFIECINEVSLQDSVIEDDMNCIKSLIISHKFVSASFEIISNNFNCGKFSLLGKNTLVPSEKDAIWHRHCKRKDTQKRKTDL